MEWVFLMPLKTNHCLEACETSKAMNGVKKVLIEHLIVSVIDGIFHLKINPPLAKSPPKNLASSVGLFDAS